MWTTVSVLLSHTVRGILLLLISVLRTRTWLNCHLRQQLNQSTFNCPGPDPTLSRCVQAGINSSSPSSGSGVGGVVCTPEFCFSSVIESAILEANKKPETMETKEVLQRKLSEAGVLDPTHSDCYSCFAHFY